MTAGPRSPGAVAILVGRRGSRCFILLISLYFRGLASDRRREQAQRGRANQRGLALNVQRMAPSLPTSCPKWSGAKTKHLLFDGQRVLQWTWARACKHNILNGQHPPPLASAHTAFRNPDQSQSSIIRNVHVEIHEPHSELSIIHHLPLRSTPFHHMIPFDPADAVLPRAHSGAVIQIWSEPVDRSGSITRKGI